MAKIKKIKEGTTTVYPATIPQAVVDPASGKTLREELDAMGEVKDITYAKLKTLRDSSELTTGARYRITDYVTTTAQTNTQSAGISFDVIVIADAENKLSEKAKATQRVGDTYFSNSDLSAWQLWYDLDNDTDKYEWADTINGRGVIYRMIDEFDNDIPYDFKNIQFLDNPRVVGPAYTFTTSQGVDLSLLRATNIYSNSMKSYKKNISGVYKQSLNRNIFIGINCYGNNFGSNCRLNTFGNYCYLNTFGSGCSLNTFGNYCYLNTFGSDCSSNTFGNDCSVNTFRNDCSVNFFGSNCHLNTFGNYCYLNTFGNDCSSNSFIEPVNNTKVGDNYSLNWIKRSSENDVDISITPDGIYQNIKSDGNGYTPVAHPNYSTQETILPQKFGNQLVYQKVIILTNSNVMLSSIPPLKSYDDSIIPLSADIISVKGYYKEDLEITGRKGVIVLTSGTPTATSQVNIRFDGDGDGSLKHLEITPSSNVGLREVCLIIEYTIPTSGYGYGY